MECFWNGTNTVCGYIFSIFFSKTSSHVHFSYQQQPQSWAQTSSLNHCHWCLVQRCLWLFIVDLTMLCMNPLYFHVKLPKKSHSIFRNTHAGSTTRFLVFSAGSSTVHLQIVQSNCSNRFFNIVSKFSMYEDHDWSLTSSRSLNNHTLEKMLEFMAFCCWIAL